MNRITTDNVGYPAGASVVTLVPGPGDIRPGDSIRFAGEEAEHEVAATLEHGVQLAEPGLRRPLAPAAHEAVVILTPAH